MLNSTTLQNGLKVATYSLPQLKSLHLEICVKGGSIVEAAKKKGVAHFLEHMLVQGIPSFPTALLFSEYVESLAGSYQATTGTFDIKFAITVPYSYLEDAVKISQEVFFQPLFPEEPIEKERAAIENELKQNIDSQWYPFRKFFLEKRFKNSCPLAHDDVALSLDSLVGIEREDLLGFWKKYFLPSNTFLVAAGNFSYTHLLTLLEKHFGSTPRPESFSGYPRLSKADFQKERVVVRRDEKLKVVYLDISFPTYVPFTSRTGKTKQAILLGILGQIRYSRLVRKLRYEEGLVYSVHATSALYPGLGFITISSQVAEENLDKVLAIISQELRVFAKKGPTRQELEFMKNYDKNQLLMAFDHPSSIISWLEGGLLWSKKLLLPEDYIPMIDSIEIEELVEFIEQYWDFSKMQVTLQGAIEESAVKEKYTPLFTFS